MGVNQNSQTTAPEQCKGFHGSGSLFGGGEIRKKNLLIFLAQMQSWAPDGCNPGLQTASGLCSFGEASYGSLSPSTWALE